MRFVWWMALRWTGLRNLPPRRLWPQRRLKYPKKAMLSGVIPPREALVTLVVIVVFLVAQKVRLPTLGEATPQPPDYRLKQHPQAGREKGDFLKHNR